MTWIKNKIMGLLIGLSVFDKKILSQSKTSDLSGVGLIIEKDQGTLLHGLKNQITNQQVKELRWRLYKVLSESKNKTAKIVGYDADGLPIVETYNIEKYKLDKVTRDNFDPYPVELVVMNEDITKSAYEAFSNDKLKLNPKGDNTPIDGKIMFDLVGADVWSGNTLAEISFDDMVSTMQSKKALYVDRDIRPKFEIEYYAKKLLVRNINETEKLLEFYVSSYQDEYDKKTKFLIGEIKKAIKNPRASNILDITKIGFITDKTIGAIDGLEYEYEVKKFDKIVEFNGHYVIKFIAEVTVNGDNIFEKYKLAELEKRYENKEAKI